jgi:agmatinase
MADRLNLPYTGIPTFMRAPLQTDVSQIDADLAVIGIPTDEGGPWKPGTRFGPRGIREQSVRFAGYGPMQARGGYFDIDAGRRFLEHETKHGRIVDCGDVDVIYTNRHQTFENITAAIRIILQRGAIPVVLGGDHGLTYPVVRAFEQPLSIVQFDAHLDFKPATEHVELSNGTPFKLISELPNIEKIVQIGIRSLRTSQDDLEDARISGVTVLTVEDFRRDGIERALDALPAGVQTYVSIDADALDLPLVPGCASAELNGLTYRELRDAAFAVAAHSEVVGLDVVEINPMIDVPSGATSLIGAQLAMELMGRVVEHPAYLARKQRSRVS